MDNYIINNSSPVKIHLVELDLKEAGPKFPMFYIIHMYIIQKIIIILLLKKKARNYCFLLLYGLILICIAQ